MRFWQDMTEANSVNEDDVFMLGDAANPNLPKFVRKKNLGVALPSWSFTISGIGKWHKIGEFTSGMVSFSLSAGAGGVGLIHNANCILGVDYRQGYNLEQSNELQQANFRIGNDGELYVNYNIGFSPHLTITSINNSTTFTPIEPVVGYTLAEIEATTKEAVIELELKQDKTDEDLQTTDKTIVGAINEVKNELQTLDAETIDVDTTQFQTIPEDVANTQHVLQAFDSLFGSLSVTDFQGSFSYYGTNAQLMAIVAPEVGSTAIVWDGVGLPTKGIYNGTAWEFSELTPTPANGMVAIIQNLLTYNSTGLISIVDDGVNPFRVDAITFDIPVFRFINTGDAIADNASALSLSQINSNIFYAAPAIV